MICLKITVYISFHNLCKSSFNLWFLGFHILANRTFCKEYLINAATTRTRKFIKAYFFQMIDLPFLATTVAALIWRFTVWRNTWNLNVEAKKILPVTSAARALRKMLVFEGTYCRITTSIDHRSKVAKDII